MVKLNNISNVPLYKGPVLDKNRENPEMIHPESLVLPGEVLCTYPPGMAYDEKADLFRCGENVYQVDRCILAACYGIACLDAENRISVVVPVVFTAGKIKAYLLLRPVRRENGYLLPDIRDIMKLNERLSLMSFLPEHQIARQIRNIRSADLWAGKRSRYILIAKGYEPRNGHDEHYILFEKPSVHSGIEKWDGSMDYKERGFIHPVRKGQPLARKVEKVEPKDGVDVFGRIIPAREQPVPKWRPGRNIKPMPDRPDILTSAMDGNFCVVNSEFYVDDTVHVSSDVHYETGNIRFSGNVRIKGDVRSSFRVECGGDLEVGGVVEEAYIHCRGDMRVNRGIVGGPKCRVVVHGNLIAGYIKNAIVRCSGDIFVDREIIQSDIFCQGRVIVQMHEHGRILGGRMAAMCGLVVNVIGAEGGPDMHLDIGWNARLHRLFLQVIETYKANQREIGMIARQLKTDFGLESLRDAKELIPKLIPARKIRFFEMIHKLEHCNRRRKRLEKIREKIDARRLPPKGAALHVLNTLHPKVILRLGPQTMTLTKALKDCVFRVDPELFLTWDRLDRRI